MGFEKRSIALLAGEIFNGIYIPVRAEGFGADCGLQSLIALQ